MKNTNRFVAVYSDGSGMRTEGIRVIIVDKETGVNYLLCKTGYGAGLTPLLDSDGKPIVTKFTE